MISGPQRLIDRYEQGALTLLGLEYQAICIARENRPETFVDKLPAEVVEAIREKTAASPDTRWLTIWGGTEDRNADPEERARSKRKDREEWLEGLARWRDYFNRSES